MLLRLLLPSALLECKDAQQTLADLAQRFTQEVKDIDELQVKLVLIFGGQGPNHTAELVAPLPKAMPIKPPIFPALTGVVQEPPPGYWGEPQAPQAPQAWRGARPQVMLTEQEVTRQKEVRELGAYHHSLQRSQPMGPEDSDANKSITASIEHSYEALATAVPADLTGKNDVVMIKGHPRKAITITAAKKGKNGLSKLKIEVLDIHTSLQYEDVKAATFVANLPQEAGMAITSGQNVEYSWLDSEMLVAQHGTCAAQLQKLGLLDVHAFEKFHSITKQAVSTKKAQSGIWGEDSA
ncbi:unnamed protein product [Prorocentrum cordatum]|uniref:Translation initiation factor 5A-like N-terminal domain-containing protein n=1 Tax=Prorocentrum cordatum TaxID=2364126 RepID=A0ABN9RTW5_9DINO|nr:unnamed protein product [Polarella glacialis]